MNNNIKNQFPIFSKNKGLVYLDSASTSQKPKVVIDKLVEFYTEYNSNVHRGLYPLSEKATDEYEKVRETIAKFINAEPNEIIFTSGATEAINGVSRSLYSSGFINVPPKITLTDLEHHSNVLPWQDLQPEMIQYLGLDDNYLINDTKIFKDSDIFASIHASNVTGTIIPIKEIITSNENAYSIIDATQSIAHMKIDVKDLDVDFLTFSGHKLFAPTGIGVLYIKEEIMKELNPFKLGGGMIDEVTRNGSTYASGPTKFEAGTPNIAAAIALAEAVRFIDSIGFEEIKLSEERLRLYLLERLDEIENIEIYHPKNVTGKEALAVVSFNIEGIHSHDISAYLGEKNICVRAGHHCTQILHRDVLNVPASLRASISVYNNEEDIAKLIEGLKGAIKIYKK
ncbi:MAG: aminotransferase class V-fold PLP-dependent enzyme [Candidatus Dojkabacteria bacterium]|nr:aminotransferase class V-fold PLP-dependent enzyme [Candidatus Dojkabacteria bacterium]